VTPDPDLIRKRRTATVQAVLSAALWAAYMSVAMASIAGFSPDFKISEADPDQSRRLAIFLLAVLFSNIAMDAWIESMQRRIRLLHRIMIEVMES